MSSWPSVPRVGDVAAHREGAEAGQLRSPPHPSAPAPRPRRRGRAAGARPPTPRNPAPPVTKLFIGTSLPVRRRARRAPARLADGTPASGLVGCMTGHRLGVRYGKRVVLARRLQVQYRRRHASRTRDAPRAGLPPHAAAEPHLGGAARRRPPHDRRGSGGRRAAHPAGRQRLHRLPHARAARRASTSSSRRGWRATPATTRSRPSPPTTTSSARGAGRWGTSATSCWRRCTTSSAGARTSPSVRSR